MSKVKKNLNFKEQKNFIKVIEENQEESQQNKSSLDEKEALKPETYLVNIRKNQLPSPINQSSIIYNDQMTPETI